MWEYLLALLPAYESRYTIPILILRGENPFIAYLLASTLNILVFPAVLLFLEKINHILLKVKLYEKFYNKLIKYTLKKKKIIEKYGYFGIFLLVFLPLPTTGVYTASIIVWLLKLDIKKSFLSIILGVFSINLLITLVSVGLSF